MKAISLKAGRSLNPAPLSASIVGRLHALRMSINPAACLTVAVIATAALFVALGAMNFTAVLVSGTTALVATALAPLNRKGGEL